jgi:hypothetical protein
MSFTKGCQAELVEAGLLRKEAVFVITRLRQAQADSIIFIM